MTVVSGFCVCAPLVPQKIIVRLLNILFRIELFIDEFSIRIQNPQLQILRENAEFDESYLLVLLRWYVRERHRNLPGLRQKYQGFVLAGAPHICKSTRRTYNRGRLCPLHSRS